jgi:hypothetical protein
MADGTRPLGDQSDYGDWPTPRGECERGVFAFLSELAPFMSAHASVPGVLSGSRVLACEGRGIWTMDDGRDLLTNLTNLIQI